MIFIEISSVTIVLIPCLFLFDTVRPGKLSGGYYPVVNLERGFCFSLPPPSSFGFRFVYVIFLSLQVLCC